MLTFEEGKTVEIKLMAGKYMRPVMIEKVGQKLFLQFKYNETLLDEIKNMEAARWHGYDETNPRKIWSIADSSRNRFQLTYLAHPGANDPLNPFIFYSKPLVNYVPSGRKLFDHQPYGVRFALTRHGCILAWEMATGKTLTAIEIAEARGVKPEEFLWVAPKSALYSVQLEFETWKAKVKPTFLTYESLKKILESWTPTRIPPKLLICDEASRVKNPTTQRSQAVKYLADQMRDHWGIEGCDIVLMSGTPSPRNPSDWFWLAEIVAPGLLREGNVLKFKNRLALIEKRNSIQGGQYPHLVTWWDDENKCKICGQSKDAPQHDPIYIDSWHTWQKSTNEVEYLYKRLKPVVDVKFKRDVLDLPEKFFKIIQLKPSQSILNAMKSIQSKSATTIEALTLCRELSDGFRYIDAICGDKQCEICKGIGKSKEFYDKNNPDEQISPQEFEKGYYFNPESNLYDGAKIDFGERIVPCITCRASGRIPRYERQYQEIETPKEGALQDILDEHLDAGRLVVYGGFQASIDRIIKICKKAEWATIRVDGRGWQFDNTNYLDDDITSPPDMLKAFNDKKNFEKVVFIGQPGAGGMGLNLQVSPTILFYSNDFNFESRSQAQERTDRPGITKGTTIIDLIHLPSDQFILENLNKKRKLQDMSLGAFAKAIENE